MGVKNTYDGNIRGPSIIGGGGAVVHCFRELDESNVVSSTTLVVELWKTCEAKMDHISNISFSLTDKIEIIFIKRKPQY